MNSTDNSINQLLNRLHEPATIRGQAHQLLQLAKEDKLNHFGIHLEKMRDTASFVVEVISEHYPDLNIPYHSRWRHFEAGNRDRIQLLRQKIEPLAVEEYGSILFELVIISVFLDAGAGVSWHYQEAETQGYYSRSEGLALASLDLYMKGMLSSHSKSPLRVDAQALISLKEHHLKEAFQITTQNSLEGLSGRVALLNRLGTLMLQKPHYFGSDARLGSFYSYMSSLAMNHSLSATTLFKTVLDAFNDVWPVRLSLEGHSLGDVWIHTALKTKQFGSEYIPFHKLSQWLSYSLIEPLEQSGIKVTHLDALTGLPEYRNGGLLIDTGLLTAKNEVLLRIPQDPASEAIIEWRGLTVALLDELAVFIRKQLHQDALSLPLARILQGGTWEAGRKIARQKRHEGLPPIQIISDGTIF